MQSKGALGGGLPEFGVGSAYMLVAPLMASTTVTLKAAFSDSPDWRSPPSETIR
jgi:hypothetical protein